MKKTVELKKLFKPEKNSVITLAENRAVIYFKRNGKTCEVAKIDTPEFPGETRCDYALLLINRLKNSGKGPSESFIFVELKGKKYQHAIEQLKETILYFKQNLDSFHCHSSHYVLSNTHNVPKASTRDQKAKVHFIKLHLPVPVCHKTKEIVNL